MSRSANRPWQLPALLDPRLSAMLQAELGIPAAGAAVLHARGFTDPAQAAALLDAGAGDLHDPFLLADLDGAARRLARAIDGDERIVVHGDYDADGISGTALLTGVLEQLGADVAPFVPDRAKDGYGVSSRLVERAGERGVSLLITVDTGSSAHEELARAKDLGIDVIVCDHHLFERRPDGATFFLNPQRDDDASPNKDLCGSAVAYKLLCGLATVHGRGFDPAEGLDLVALALLADQMRLQGENRALVRMGLLRMQLEPRPGLIALLECTRLLGQAIDAGDVLFQLAPRINAAGRIEKARTAVDLLLAREPSEARPLAAKLDQLNLRRREMDAQLGLEATEQAVEQLRGRDRQGLVLASERWHMGVVGIGAARIVEDFHRPAILLAIDGDEARGSARSVAGLDLKAALDLCAKHLTRYGGHAAAAGVTLPVSAIEGFRECFDQAVSSLPRNVAPPVLSVDAILGLGALDSDLVHFLHRFGPCGQGHAEPLFGALGLDRVGELTVLKGKHLKLQLAQQGKRRGFIGFSLAEPYADLVRTNPCLDAAFHVGYREGTPFDPWQLRLRALRKSERTMKEVSS